MNNSTVGTIAYLARIDTGQLASDSKKAEAIAKSTGDKMGDEADRASKKADAAFGRFAQVIGAGMLAAGAAAGAGLAIAIKSAGAYESSLSQLKQASGATGAEMASMSKLARELGQSNDLAGVSASDAAATMLELSKAGLSVKDTMDSSKAVMSLAKAGNIEFADAAVIAASALNAFGLQGKDAILVADTLAAGANASQAELGDLALGMQQSATVAKQFGLSLNESVTALALFANNGIRGSDAGTSLKTMLIALAKPSKDAAGAMKEIGFQAYDAQGKFVGLDEMSKRLKKSTAKLTDEQKQNALATIFGTDAFRAAAVLADNAGDSYSNMSAELNKAGSAQKAAAAQMGPFEKATEGLKNSMAELGLTIGSKAAPKVTELINKFSGLVSTVNAGIPGIIQTFVMLAPAIAGAAVAMTGFAIVVNTASTAAKAMAIAQGALNLVMNANPIGLLITGVAALAAFYLTLSSTTEISKNSTDRLNAARNASKVANEAAATSEGLLRNALLAQQGSALAVEAATIRRDQAVKTAGAGSLEARQAELDLAYAVDGKARADREATKAQEDRDRKQAESNAKKKEVEEAEAAKQRSIVSTTEKVGSQIGSIDLLVGKLNGLKGQTFSYTVEQATRIIGDGVSSPETKKNAAKALGYAKGGYTGRGGENEVAGVVHKGEYVLPQSAVDQSTGMPKLDGIVSGGGGTTFHINQITISKEVDGERWLRRLSGNQEITGVGLVPNQQYMGAA